MVTAPITAGSTATDKQDATFVEAAGLANPSCVSFESINKPGSYLRHQNFQFHLQPNDGSTVFAQDATFCPGTGNSGQGASFQSVNFPGRYIRAFENTVYLASNGGIQPLGHHHLLGGRLELGSGPALGPAPARHDPSAQPAPGLINRFRCPPSTVGTGSLSLPRAPDHG